MSDAMAARKAQVRATFNGLAPEYDAGGPGCFVHFGQRLVEETGIEAGQRVLDVATGRGAVLFPAAERVGVSGIVTGIDLSEEMIRITRDDAMRRGLNAQLRVMDAEHLDFPDAAFDRVLCGFGVMFFPDLPLALHEFRRVLAPQGRIGLSTWRVSQGDTLGLVLAELGIWQGGKDPALQFGDPATVEGPLVAAGFSGVRVQMDEAMFRYRDLEAYWQNCRGTGMRRYIDALDAAQTERVKTALAERLRPHEQPDGIHLAATALLATAAR